MKTTKNAEKNKPDFSMTTPSDILEEVGIAEAKCAELHRIKHGVAIIQGRMTAFEMIETIEELSKLAEFLTVQLFEGLRELRRLRCLRRTGAGNQGAARASGRGGHPP